MTRVLTGDVRLGWGGETIVVIGTRRGRRGEDRTLVTIGHHIGDGIVEESETRTYAAVQARPWFGRVRVSVRDQGGYHIAPWKGRIPAVCKVQS